MKTLDEDISKKLAKYEIFLNKTYSQKKSKTEVFAEKKIKDIKSKTENKPQIVLEKSEAQPVKESVINEPSKILFETVQNNKSDEDLDGLLNFKISEDSTMKIVIGKCIGSFKIQKNGCLESGKKYSFLTFYIFKGIHRIFLRRWPILK